MLHHGATARTLAAARVLVGVVWIVRLAGDPVSRLGYLPDELWFGQGLMALLPGAAVGALTTSTSLSLMKFGGIILSIWVILGLKGARTALVALVSIMALYLGLTKGFGGHVNHRELVPLYVTAVLILTPCFDAYSWSGPKPESRSPEIYQASMLTLCLTIVISYMFIGIARATIGFPGVFDPNVMEGWLMDRAVRPNPVGSRLGEVLLSMPGSTVFIATMLPISTALEVAAPATLWVGQRLRLVIVGGLALFHIAILAFMNITFVENILLLALLFNYTPLLEKPKALRPNAEQPHLGGES